MHSENCSYMILNAFTAVARLDLGWILVRITCILEVLVWSSRYISYIIYRHISTNSNLKQENSEFPQFPLKHKQILLYFLDWTMITRQHNRKGKVVPACHEGIWWGQV